MQTVSIIASRNLCIVRHTCHRRVHLLWLAFICTVFQLPTYFLWSVCTIFGIFCVPASFLIQGVWFWGNFDKMILRSTSEARIWFLAVTLITLIIRVELIKGWFIIHFLLFLLIKAFLSGVWTYTMNSYLLRKVYPLIISYWIF